MIEIDLNVAKTRKFIVFVDHEMVPITPGIALGSSVVGITPGAALEKKSVRDLAAGFAANKIGKLSSTTLVEHSFSMKFC